MFQNKLFNIGLMLLILIGIVGIAILVVYKAYLTPASGVTVAKQKPVPTAQQLADSQYLVDKLTTNLQDNGIIEVQFALQADSAATKSELDIRKLQVKDAIISILHETSGSDLKKPGGYDKLKQEIMTSIDHLLSKGNITDVYMPDIVLQ